MRWRAENKSEGDAVSKELQDLRLQASELRERISRLESVERHKENAKLIGKCFVYRNCYSCPSGPEDYWNLYQRITAMTKDGNLRVFSFQTDKDGQITIESRSRSAGSLGEPLSPAKFRAAWKVTKRHVESFGGLSA
jgi:hypothetical protein